MDESASRHPLIASMQPSAECKGVRGWLLALCLMFTLVGPVISAWLIAEDFTRASPLGSKPFVVQFSVLASLLLSTCAVAFGAYAGMRLWRIRPNAVLTAKRALLFGLAVEVVTTTFGAMAADVSGDQLLWQLQVSLVPSLIFFTLCFAYLNRSKRVYATYGPSRTQA